MKLIERKGYENTTIRTVVNDFKAPVATIGTVDDLTLKAELFIDGKEARENFGKWAVLWHNDMFHQYLFDTRKEAIEYLFGDD